jgi:hypothetical protein
MILITGAARSGTTLTAKIFGACGANLGTVNGLHENTAVREGVCKPYLRSIGADPLGQDPLPDTLSLAPVEDWANIVRFKLGPGVNCYKGAKMCLMWPVWHAAFPDAKWVIVRRDPKYIAESCVRTSFMRAFPNREGWLRWVAEHEARFEQMRVAGLDIVEVWPGEFIEGYEDGMRNAVTHCDLTWDSQAARECITKGKFQR